MCITDSLVVVVSDASIRWNAFQEAFPAFLLLVGVAGVLLYVASRISRLDLRIKPLLFFALVVLFVLVLGVVIGLSTSSYCDSSSHKIVPASMFVKDLADSYVTVADVRIPLNLSLTNHTVRCADTLCIDTVLQPARVRIAVLSDTLYVMRYNQSDNARDVRSVVADVFY